jgi:hypothetical protein
LSPTIIAAVWGLCGAAPYAVTRLATSLWSTAETAPHQRKMAAALFLVALLSGPTMAAATAPWIAGRFNVALATVAGGIGLISNGIWPLLSDPKVLGPMVANVLTSMGGWLLKLGSKVGRTDDG